jgi:hypothetical protein
MHRFAQALSEDVWSHGRFIERRLTHGEARANGAEIDATDRLDETLVAACEREMERLRTAMPRGDARVRTIADARREDDALSTSATMTIRIGSLSIVTAPETASEDFELLRAIASVPPDGAPIADRTIPVVWRNGSAAVLLHEAIGHPREHGLADAGMPPWLDVAIGFAERRASFRDVPMQRMTELVATQHDASFELPPRRVEVLLVGGGSFEPLTGEVTLEISAADFVDGDRVRRLPAFAMRESRAAFGASIAGAYGNPIRYPGVVCSREGQELVVGSFAPVLLTVFA